MPSACGALTSAPRSSRRGIAAESFFSVASASGASAAQSVPLTSSNAVQTQAVNSLTLMGRLPSRISDRKGCEQFIDLAVAVGERVETHADLVQQRQMQIGQRRSLVVADMPPAAHLSGGAASDDDRQVD